MKVEWCFLLLVILAATVMNRASAKPAKPDISGNGRGKKKTNQHYVMLSIRS